MANETVQLMANEKQDQIQWETVQIDNYKHNKPCLLDFEIDLMLKIRYLLSNKQSVQLWIQYSAAYQLSPCDLSNELILKIYIQCQIYVHLDYFLQAITEPNRSIIGSDHKFSVFLRIQMQKLNKYKK